MEELEIWWDERGGDEKGDESVRGKGYESDPERTKWNLLANKGPNTQVEEAKKAPRKAMTFSKPGRTGGNEMNESKTDKDKPGVLEVEGNSLFLFPSSQFAATH